MNTKHTKHTPGPWALTADHDEQRPTYLIGTNAEPDIARVHDIIEQAESNARLIAAAPELLAACASALQAADEMGIECPAADDLRAAIAKATGNTSADL